MHCSNSLNSVNYISLLQLISSSSCTLYTAAVLPRSTVQIDTMPHSTVASIISARRCPDRTPELIRTRWCWWWCAFVKLYSREWVWSVCSVQYPCHLPPLQRRPTPQFRLQCSGSICIHSQWGVQMICTMLVRVCHCARLSSIVRAHYCKTILNGNHILLQALACTHCPLCTQHYWSIQIELVVISEIGHWGHSFRLQCRCVDTSINRPKRVNMQILCTDTLGREGVHSQAVGDALPVCRRLVVASIDTAQLGGKECPTRSIAHCVYWSISTTLSSRTSGGNTTPTRWVWLWARNPSWFEIFSRVEVRVVPCLPFRATPGSLSGSFRIGWSSSMGEARSGPATSALWRWTETNRAAAPWKEVQFYMSSPTRMQPSVRWSPTGCPLIGSPIVLQVIYWTHHLNQPCLVFLSTEQVIASKSGVFYKPCSGQVCNLTGDSPAVSNIPESLLLRHSTANQCFNS